MQSWKIGFITATMLAALAIAAHAQSAAPKSDPLQLLPARAIDIEVKGMKVKELFQLLHEIAKVEIAVDACVGEKTVDMKLMNVPLHIVAEALAAQLGLHYEQDGARLAVTCRAG